MEIQAGGKIFGENRSSEHRRRETGISPAVSNAKHVRGKTIKTRFFRAIRCTIQTSKVPCSAACAVCITYFLSSLCIVPENPVVVFVVVLLLYCLLL